jgi:Flp pilus assembly protein TadG
MKLDVPGRPGDGAAPVGLAARRRSSRGVVAVEFALLFPAFFLIFYAIITYGLIMAAQQTLTLAAAEGARAAVRYPSNPSSVADSVNQRISAACTAASAPLAWLKNLGGLGAAAGCGTSASAPGVNVASDVCAYASTLTCVTVTVTYNYGGHPLIPNLLGGLLSLPTPARLTGTAVMQIDPAYLL